MGAELVDASHAVMLPPIDEFEQEAESLAAFDSDDGFAFLLEALGEDDARATLHGQAASPSSAQHHSFEPSNSFENQTEGFEFAFEAPIPDELADVSVPNDEAQHLNELPTAGETRLEKRRAINRRNQKAFRKRQRELQAAMKAQVDATTRTLADAREKWRLRRLQRSSLRQRLKAALQNTASCDHNTPIAFNHHAESVRGPPEECNGQKMDLKSLQSHDSSPAPKTAPGHQFSAKWSRFSRQNEAYSAEGQSRGLPRPISSFARCEGLSFAAVSEFMAPSKASAQAYQYNAITHAVAAYQHSVSTRTGVAVSDICWFQQWRFPGMVPDLSFTAGGSSPECCLCAHACLVMSSCEAMFLVVEHETLLSASDPSYIPPEHPSLAVGDPPSTPNPPDPRLLRSFHLQCGINQKLPLKLALDRTLKPLLAKYRASLPQNRWRAVCMQAMRIFQAIIGALSESTEASEGGVSAESGVSDEMHEGSDCDEFGAEDATRSIQSTVRLKIPVLEEGMGWKDLRVALATSCKHMLCCIHEALENLLNKDCEGNTGLQHEAEGRTLLQVEERMFELACTKYMFKSTLLKVAPIMARRMNFTSFLSQNKSLLKVCFPTLHCIEPDRVYPLPRITVTAFKQCALKHCSWKARRQSMMLYKQLQLQPDQRTCMADRWRSWCRRRASLGQKQVSALARFEKACPQQISVPTVLGRCNTPVATAAETGAPVGTPHQGAVQAIRKVLSTDVPALNAYVSEPTNALESCTGPSAQAMHDMHPMMQKLQTAARFSKSAISGGQDEVLKDSARMHGGHACMHAASIHNDTQELGHAEMGAHELSNNPIFPRSYSRISPYARNFVKQGNSANSESKQVPSRERDFSGTDGSTHGADADAPAVYSLHDYTCSAGVTDAVSALSSAPYAFQACILCSSHGICFHALDNLPAAHDTAHERHNAWATCIECETGYRALLLGESGEVAKAAYDALGGLLDVHDSDARMHHEFIGPFWELREKQETVFMAAAIDLGQPTVDIAAMWQAAAEEERREALFGHISALHI